MKVVQVQMQAEAAGAQRISDLVAAGMRSTGHDVHTVFVYRKTAAYDHDPNVTFIAKTPPRHIVARIIAVMGLIRYLRKERPDAVITYQYWGNIFGALGARLAGVGRVIANQSGAPRRRGLVAIASWLDRFIGARGWYDVNIVNSSWTAAQFADYPPSYRRFLHRIDHGVLPLQCSLGSAAARRQFSLPLDVPLIVSSGRLTADKNQGVLVAVLAQLTAAHVALAGAGKAYQHQLRQMAQNLDVADRLHFVGELDQAGMATFLGAGDVFAFPSRFETFGLAPVEAAIAGLPVVANDIEVLREVLTCPVHGAAALFAPSDRADLFARCIAEILASAELRASLSRAGEQLARRYSTDRMCRAYENLLAATAPN